VRRIGRGGRSSRYQVRAVAHRGVTPAQVALAWLLAHFPVLLAIPGTQSIDQLEENVDAAVL